MHNIKKHILTSLKQLDAKLATQDDISEKQVYEACNLSKTLHYLDKISDMEIKEEVVEMKVKAHVTTQIPEY